MCKLKNILSVYSCAAKFTASDQSTKFAEVLYFAIITCGDVKEAVAVVSLYRDPHPELLSISSETYYLVKHLCETGIKVIQAKSIQAVVAMIPDYQFGKYIQDGTHLDWWQVVEKPGLKLAERLLHDDEQCLDDFK